MTDPPGRPARPATPSTSSCRACCTRGSSARRTRTRGSSASTPRDVPDGVVVLTPDDVRDLGALRLPDRATRPCSRSTARATSAIPWPPWRPTTAGARRRGAALVEVDYEELPAVFDVVEAAAAGAPLVHETHAVSEQPGRLLRDAAASPGRTSATASGSCTATSSAGFAEADVVVEETYRIAGAQHAAHGAARVASPRWDGDRLDGLDRHADAVQRPRGPRARLRHAAGARPRRRAADGRLLRREDVRPRSRRSRPRSRARRGDR